MLLEIRFDERARELADELHAVSPSRSRCLEQNNIGSRPKMLPDPCPARCLRLAVSAGTEMAAYSRMECTHQTSRDAACRTWRKSCRRGQPGQPNCKRLVLVGRRLHYSPGTLRGRRRPARTFPIARRLQPDHAAHTMQSLQVSAFARRARETRDQT